MAHRVRVTSIDGVARRATGKMLTSVYLLPSYGRSSLCAYLGKVYYNPGMDPLRPPQKQKA